LRRLQWLTLMLCIATVYSAPTSSRAYFKYVQPHSSPVIRKHLGVAVKVKATGYFGPKREDYTSKKEYLRDCRINGKGKETNSGTAPKIGTIAADKRFYKFGTKVFIPEINLIGTIEDIGSKIKGPHRIDIFCGHGKRAKKIAKTWGDGTNVTMIIIKTVKAT